MKSIAVFITAGSKREAEIIARDLVKKKLAACVNLLPSVESFYTWKGKAETSKEFLLIAKTKDRLFSGLERAVKRLHSYECPEIVAFRLTKGSAGYMRWLGESTRP